MGMEMWGPLFAVQLPGNGLGGSVQGPARPPKSPPAPSTPFPGRSYVGAALKDGHKAEQGREPALELGTRRGQHCHTRGTDGHRGQQQRARRKLYLAAGICLFFMVGEAVGECWGPAGPVGSPRSPSCPESLLGGRTGLPVAFCGSEHPAGPHRGGR